MVDFPEGFDLAALLEPIAGDAPQGEDIREDSSAQSPYYRLKDARSGARDAERMLDNGDLDAEDPAPLWRTVRELGLRTLQEKTKDLEVAAWVAEAYVRSHGLPGLAAGAALLKGLAGQYWDMGIFPLPDEYDGEEARTAPITGLSGREGNGSLVQPLNKIILFMRPEGSPVTLSTYKTAYKASETFSTLTPEQKEARLASGAVPFSEFDKEARGPTALRNLGLLRDQAAFALEHWMAMGELLDAKATEAPPSNSSVREIVREIREVAIRYAPAAAVTVQSASEESGDGGSDGGGGAMAGGMMLPGGFSVPSQRIASREDALRTLESLATFFRQTEPVSPLAYTLDDAIRRARMSWPDLLAEVVSDQAVRSAILSSLGIRPPPSEEAAAAVE